MPEPSVGDTFTDREGDRWELVRGATDHRGRWLLFAVYHDCGNPDCTEPALTAAALEPGQWASSAEGWGLVKA